MRRAAAQDARLCVGEDISQEGEGGDAMYVMEPTLVCSGNCVSNSSAQFTTE